MANEFIVLIKDFCTYIFNGLVGQLGLSVAVILVACLFLKLFSVNFGYIKRFIGNSILGVLALYGLKALGIISSISVIDIILVSLFGIVGIIFIVADSVFGISSILFK